MSPQDDAPRFTVVRRGYDPREVDEYVREMWDRAVQWQEHHDSPSSELSRRLTQILDLANEEAGDIRAQARTRSDEIVAEARARADAMVENRSTFHQFQTT